jgi:hypothetical protein
MVIISLKNITGNQSFYGGGGYPLGGNYDSYSGTMEGRLPSLNQLRKGL